MKLKTIVFSIALMLLATGGLLAQDKYEHGVLTSNFVQLVFSVNGTTDVYNFEKKDYPIQLTMKKLDDLSLQGWELISVTEVGEGAARQTRYFLRKKKNQ